MKKYWKIAPAAARRIAVVGFVTAAILIPLQLFELYLVVSRAAEQMTGMDPFAVIDGSDTTEQRPIGEMFLSGFTTSLAATMGSFAVIAATRLIVPYRNRSLKMVWAGGISHLVLAVTTVIGVAIGNRSVDAGTIGTVVSALWVLPVLAMSFHPLVRAWAVAYTPPPPELPEQFR